MSGVGAMALHLPLADSGQLTFMAHGNGRTATFDVAGASARLDARVYPRYEARGWTGVCCNITKAQARQLRDALSTWIGDLPTEEYGVMWKPVHEAGVAGRVRWVPDTARAVRRCPRTWPHDPHGPWFTGEIVPAQSVGGVSFTCPGIPYPTKETNDES